jgi:hypothetical protein
LKTAKETASTGKDCGISEAVVSDHAVGPASGIDLAGLWHAFAHADDD